VWYFQITIFSALAGIVAKRQKRIAAMARFMSSLHYRQQDGFKRHPP
jgi:hypothetical protein